MVWKVVRIPICALPRIHAARTIVRYWPSTIVSTRKYTLRYIARGGHDESIFFRFSCEWKFPAERNRERKIRYYEARQTQASPSLADAADRKIISRPQKRKHLSSLESCTGNLEIFSGGQVKSATVQIYLGPCVEYPTDLLSLLFRKMGDVTEKPDEGKDGKEKTFFTKIMIIWISLLFGKPTPLEISSWDDEKVMFPMLVLPPAELEGG